MKKLIVPAVLLAPMLLFAVVSTLCACKKSDSSSFDSSTTLFAGDSAAVMFVNGCTGTTILDTTAVNAKVNGNSINYATGIAFNHYSGYEYAPVGANVNLAYYLLNKGTQLINKSTSLSAGNLYSAFIGGFYTNPTLFIVQDDLLLPPIDSIKIRLVNLSPDTLSLTATAQSITFASGIASDTISAFIKIPAGTYDIKVGDPSDVSSIVSINSQQLTSRKTYTVMYTGTKNAAAGSPFIPKVTILNN